MTRDKLEKLFSEHYEGKKVLGTDYLSKEDQANVLALMEYHGFTPFK